MKLADNAPGFAALIPRTAALLILLYQIRLLAADLADTSIFVAALAGALFTAVFLHREKIAGLKISPLQAIIVIALVPWVIRFFIAMPRWFFPGVSQVTIFLDSLLLNLDRNNFTSLLPFYWVAVTTYFCQRSRTFLRADIIAAIVFFLVLFSIVPTVSMEVYRWPVLMIGLFALVFFLQIISFIFSAPPELKLRKKEGIIAAVFLFLIIILGAAFFVRPFQQRAVERGGGLLEPRLFRFDFSQVLRLESEISLTDELVLIVRKDPFASNGLLRRFTMSGYDPRKGFFRIDGIDEAAHPQRLPNRRTVLPAPEIKNYRITKQEYFIVNFDSTAFIGMNQPVEVIPFETWDASSFNSAYAVISHTSNVLPFELIDVVRGPPGPENLGLSPEEFAIYTYYGGDERVAAFAREIIQRSSGSFLDRDSEFIPSYWEKIQMIYDRLKFGEFRYSLRPGIAADGNQLHHFLFTSKRGYCTYFAFAFTLMLRSLGIPSRIAAGFFVDHSTEVFNYFPVRADMAHAWVEVWFPGYGWIEYDPTTERLAEGEEFRFSEGTPPELFERLMREIMENRSRLREREGADPDDGGMNLAAIGRMTYEFFSQKGPFLALGLLVFLFLWLRSGSLWLSHLHKNPRKKALYLWAHTRRRLALAGLKKPPSTGEAEWAKAELIQGVYSIYLTAAAARFAPDYSFADSLNMAEHYRIFCEEYRKALPLRRRLLAWFIPPLALICKPSVNEPLIRQPSVKPPHIGMIILLVFLFSLLGETGAQEGAETSFASFSEADILYNNAMSAIGAENWERAIEFLNMGSRSFPEDYRFPWTLGNLYFQRRLHWLAWDEFLRAERIIPWEPSLLLRLASTAGHLNKNDVSAAYLERFLVLDPDNREAISSLAWMYFKLHRLEEGEQLLLSAMERLGFSADFAMTLGTIYSGMFRYDEAKAFYLRAIERAEAIGDRLFAAVCHYNLSLLESRFYHFALAYERANASINAMNRASGRLARGELYLRRLELPRAVAELQEAYQMDISPLSKLNLAVAFKTGGRLREAALHAEACLRSGDLSWMLNFGIDPVRYKRDIHEILRDTYRGLFRAEAFFIPANFRERVQSVSRLISYRFRYAVHTHLFRKYSLLAANAFVHGQEIHLSALIKYFNAFEAYPRRALAYLAAARRFEVPLIPQSAPSYDFEEARHMRNRRQRSDALNRTLLYFDPLWQRDMMARVSAELARTGRRYMRQDAAAQLFFLNPGAMLRNGIRLPVDIQITGELSGSRMERVLRRAARDAGLEQTRSGGRHILVLRQAGEGMVSAELRDEWRGITHFRRYLAIPSEQASRRAAAAQRAAFARELQNLVFDAF